MESCWNIAVGQKHFSNLCLAITYMVIGLYVAWLVITLYPGWNSYGMLKEQKHFLELFLATYGMLTKYFSAQKTFWNCVWTQDYFITWIKFLGNAGGIFHPKTLSRAVFPTRTQTFITWLFNVHKCLQTLAMPQTFSESVFGIHLVLFSQMKFTCGTMPKGHFLGAKKKLFIENTDFVFGIILAWFFLNEIHKPCRGSIFSQPKTLAECVLWIQLAWFS